MSIQAAQIKRIHVLRKDAGLDDDSYRAALQAVAGVTTSKDLTAAQADLVIDRLQGFQRTFKAPHPRALPMSGTYGRKVQALWICGWHLGVVRDRTDEAACAFIERQTGIARASWLRDAADARKVVEAIKHWLAREAGVEWPRVPDALAHKRAVILAQWRRLASLGVLRGAASAGPDAGLQPILEAQVRRPVTGLDDDSLTAAELDALIATIGARIRRGAGR